MKSLHLMIALLAMTLTACGFDGDAKPGPAPIKEDVAKIKNPSEDYCDLYDWYGDGVCDGFCLSPDPDCEANCDAYPACGVNEIQVDSCEGIAACSEETICGNTIYCADENPSCLTIAPACGPDESPVDQCDPDDARCTHYDDGCGAELYCWKEADDCQAVPVCPDSTYEVEACQDVSECHEVTVCGQTILCQQDAAHCEAYPSCPEGSVQVDVCPGDSTCFEEYLCGYGITCMEDPSAVCEALPVCDPGHTEVDECPADTSCYQRTACGETITCAEYGATCLAIPVCDADSYQVSNQDCAASQSTCERESMCGQTIFCKERPLACPEIVGTPPSCSSRTTETSGCAQRELDAGTCSPVFGSGDQCASLIYCRE